MELAELGEFGLIGVFRRMLEDGGEGVRVGLGDDAASAGPGGRDLLAFTSDMLVEGVHFDLSFTDPLSLGYKSLAVNLSDLAAMGGHSPSWAVVSVAIPAGLAIATIEEFYRGLKEAAGKHGCTLVGGDTVRSPDRLVINVALLGTVGRDDLLLRSGARPGDALMLTGEVGASALGLAALMKHRGDKQKYSHYVNKHLQAGAPPGHLGLPALARGHRRHRLERRPAAGPRAHLRGERHRRRAGDGEDTLPAAFREAAAALKVDLVHLALGGGRTTSCSWRWSRVRPRPCRRRGRPCSSARWRKVRRYGSSTPRGARWTSPPAAGTTSGGRGVIVPVALTVAGSDSGGGAGIQADLKAFFACGVHGTCAITSVTVQNTVEVRDRYDLPPGVVRAQMRAVLDDLPPAAAKTGMLAAAPIIHAVAETLREYAVGNLVVDPVMVSTSGHALLD